MSKHLLVVGGAGNLGILQSFLPSFLIISRNQVAQLWINFQEIGKWPVWTLELILKLTIIFYWAILLSNYKIAFPRSTLMSKASQRITIQSSASLEAGAVDPLKIPRFSVNWNICIKFTSFLHFWVWWISLKEKENKGIF